MNYFSIVVTIGLFVCLFPSVASAATITQPTVASRADSLSVVVSWTTSENASSKVSYGADSSTDTTTPEYPSNTMHHQMLIMNLIPEETYAFMAISQTKDGEILQSDAITLTMPAFNGRSSPTLVETIVGSPSFLAPWKQQVRSMEPGFNRSAMLTFLTLLDQFSLLRVATLICALGILGYADARRKQASFQVVDAITHEPIATTIMSFIDTAGRIVRQISATAEGVIHMAWPMTKPVHIIIEADGYQARQIVFDRDLYAISLSKAGSGSNVTTENWMWRLQHSLKYQHYIVWVLGILMVLLSISQSFDAVSQSLIILYIGLGILVIKTHPQTYQFAQLVDTRQQPLASVPVNVVYDNHVDLQTSDTNGYIQLYYPLPTLLRVTKAGDAQQSIPINRDAIQGIVAIPLVIPLGGPNVSATPTL